MIKILYLINKMKPAGAQNHLQEVITGLDRTRFDPTLITLEELGVKRIYGVSGLKGLFKLVRIMKEGRFDIVHTYLFSENILGAIAAKLAGVPIVVTGRRDTGMLCQGGWQHILAYRLTNRWTDKIICVSEAVRKVVLEKERPAPQKAEVIYNGVDMNKFDLRPTSIACRQKLGIKNGEVVVGMIANFSWVKGHDVLLAAAPEIISAVPNTKFLLVGDGPLLARCKSEATDRRLADKISFLGKRSDIPELLSIMDVSLNLSYSEGMSNTILESMAAGVPVVATAVDGNLETVDEETGILVPSKNSAAVTKAVIGLLKDADRRRRLAENARRAVRERFNSRLMITKMERLYSELWEAVRDRTSSS